MLKKLSLTICVAVATLIFYSCSTPAAESTKEIDMDQLRSEIQAKEDAYAAAEKAKDPAGVAEYYSDDAISYSRNREPDNGKAAITARIDERMKKDTTNNYNVYKVEDLFPQGDMLVEVGSWKNFDPAGTELEHGYYMSYFQMKDSTYKCVRDMSITTSPEKPRQ